MQTETIFNMKPRINKLLRKCSERPILFMKNIVLHNMCLMQRIPEAEFDPEEKYWQRYLRSELSANMPGCTAE